MACKRCGTPYGLTVYPHWDYCPTCGKEISENLKEMIKRRMFKEEVIGIGRWSLWKRICLALRGWRRLDG